MNDIIGMLMNQLGEDGIESMGKQAGLDSTQTKMALESAIPILLGAMAKNTSDSNGANALAGALDRDHDGSILDNLSGFLSSGNNELGGGILKHILGGQTSQVENGLGEKTGISSGSMATILKIAAPILLGLLGKQKKEQGLDAGGLGSLISMASKMGGSSQGGIDLGDLIGMVTGNSSAQSKGGGLIGMLGGLFGKK